MKTTERTVPELVQASREAEATGEEALVDTDWVDETIGSGSVVAPVTGNRSAKRGKALKTVEIDLERDRRATLISPIPAMVAEWMRKETEGEASGPAARDPAAPLEAGGGGDDFGGGGELTRPIGDSSDKQDASARGVGHDVEEDDGNAERRQRAARSIDRARGCLEADDLAGAARAVEEAFAEADQAAAPGIVEVIEPARALLYRILTAYVGPLSGVPVLAGRGDDFGALALDARMRALVDGVDGVRSLAQIFDAARIPAGEALRITATLLRAGVVRMA